MRNLRTYFPTTDLWQVHNRTPNSECVPECLCGAFKLSALLDLPEVSQGLVHFWPSQRFSEYATLAEIAPTAHAAPEQLLFAIDAG